MSEYWSVVVQNTIASFAAILASFVVYWLTIRSTDNSAREAKTLEEKNQLQAFCLVVKNAISTAKKQSEALAAFLVELNNHPGEFPKMNMYPTGNLTAIVNTTSIEKTGMTYLKYFPGDTSVRNFAGMLDSIDYLRQEFEGLKDLNERATINDYDRRMRFSETFDKTGQYIIDYFINNSSQDPLVQSLQAIKSHFNANRGAATNLNAAKDLYFIPLNEFTKLSLSAGNQQRTMMELAFLSSKGLEYYSHIDAGYEKYIAEITGIRAELNKNISKLENEANSILSSSFKL